MKQEEIIRKLKNMEKMLRAHYSMPEHICKAGLTTFGVSANGAVTPCHMLTDENEEEKEILTFGPVCIHPSYQRMGYGKLLISHSLAEASCLGYDTVVIFGSPSNYVTMGFQSCRKHNVSLENGRYPAAMMVNELVPDALSGHRWIYKESPAMEVSEEEALAYDSTLEKMERKHTPSQEEFYIISRSFIE